MNIKMHMMLLTWTALGIKADFLWTSLRKNKSEAAKYINTHLLSKKAIIVLPETYY
jgi:hypothetical protein